MCLLNWHLAKLASRMAENWTELCQQLLNQVLGICEQTFMVNSGDQMAFPVTQSESWNLFPLQQFQRLLRTSNEGSSQTV